MIHLLVALAELQSCDPKRSISTLYYTERLSHPWRARHAAAQLGAVCQAVFLLTSGSDIVLSWGTGEEGRSMPRLLYRIPSALTESARVQSSPQAGNISALPEARHGTRDSCRCIYRMTDTRKQATESTKVGGESFHTRR